MTDCLTALALLLARPVAPPVAESPPPPAAAAMPAGEPADPCPQFPPAAVCAEYAAFAAAHAEWAWNQHVRYPSERATASYARGAEDCAFAWALAARLQAGCDLPPRDADDPFWGPSGRYWAGWGGDGCEDLLRFVVGPDAFAAGAMPPPAPAWAGPYWGQP